MNSINKKNTITGRLIWADLEKTDKWGKYTATVTIDRNNPDWQQFVDHIKDVCADDDVCVSADDVARSIGEWGSTQLNELDGSDRWHEADLSIRAKTKSLPHSCDTAVRTGDTVTMAYQAATYSFQGDEGELIEGVTLYLNGLRSV